MAEIDNLERFKAHAMRKVHEAQGLPESEWAEFNRPDNVNVTYTRAAEELIREGYLAEGDHHGYRPGPRFEEGLKKYGIVE